MKKSLLFIFGLSIFLNACGSANSVPAVILESDESDTAPISPDLIAEIPYESLSFDAFLEISYRDLILRKPESYVELALDYIYEIDPTELNNLSDEYVEETYHLYQIVLNSLHLFDRDILEGEEQLSYDIYEAFLIDVLNGYDFRQYSYLEIGFLLSSTSYQTEFFFSDTHPMEDIGDAENYLTRLGHVAEKFSQLIGSLKSREAKKLIPPKFLVSSVLSRVRSVAQNQAAKTIYYTALKEKLALIDDLADVQKQDFLDQAENIIDDSIIPAYQDLLDYLISLEKIAPTKEGVWQFDQGDAYYQYLLAHHTSTTLTADEIHDLGLQELERIHAEMRIVFAQLGYSQDSDLKILYQQVANQGGTLSGQAIMDEYENLLFEANENVAAAFSVLPIQEVIVIGGDIGGFYVSGSFDGTRPGAFYANNTGSNNKYTMPTLTYHETIPGHHLQIALAQETELPTFRRVETLTAYVEGWALYAERLAWELGWYADDPYGNLGRLQFEAFRAARLVVDTGLHAKGWTFDQAATFFAENTGFARNFSEGQIFRYTALPGQATSYMIGMLKILELRQNAQDQLGEKFDIKEFHQIILGSGSMPLDILEQVVFDYISAPGN